MNVQQHYLKQSSLSLIACSDPSLEHSIYSPTCTSCHFPMHGSRGTNLVMSRNCNYEVQHRKEVAWLLILGCLCQAHARCRSWDTFGTRGPRRHVKTMTRWHDRYICNALRTTSAWSKDFLIGLLLSSCRGETSARLDLHRPVCVLGNVESQNGGRSFIHALRGHAPASAAETTTLDPLRYRH